MRVASQLVVELIHNIITAKCSLLLLAEEASQSTSKSLNMGFVSSIIEEIMLTCLVS
jgi:hypothetical protein